MSGSNDLDTILKQTPTSTESFPSFLSPSLGTYFPILPWSHLVLTFSYFPFLFFPLYFFSLPFLGVTIFTSFITSFFYFPPYTSSYIDWSLPYPDFLPSCDP